MIQISHRQQLLEGVRFDLGDALCSIRDVVDRNDSSSNGTDCDCSC